MWNERGILSIKEKKEAHLIELKELFSLLLYISNKIFANVCQTDTKQVNFICKRYKVNLAFY